MFQAAKLATDKLEIVEYYADHGFIDARVERIEKTVEPGDAEEPQLVITVYVGRGRAVDLRGA